MCISGIYATPELEWSVCMGYTILKEYKVYHWSPERTTYFNMETKQGGLFVNYISDWQKYKQGASGFPTLQYSREPG